MVYTRKEVTAGSLRRFEREMNTMHLQRHLSAFDIAAVLRRGSSNLSHKLQPQCNSSQQEMLKWVALEIQSLFTDLRLSASTVDGPIDTFLISRYFSDIANGMGRPYNELPEEII